MFFEKLKLVHVGEVLLIYSIFFMHLKQFLTLTHIYIYIYIYIYIQVHLNKLECRGKVNLFQ